MNSDPMSLAELLALQNEDFVEAAYRTVLGREADPAGRSYYASRIRAGHSKLSVLYQLRNSRESRGAAAVPGLRRALSRYRLGRLPVVGWLFRKLFNIEGEGTAERHLRAIVSEIAALRADIAAQPVVAAQTAAPTSYRSAQPKAVPESRRKAVAENLSPRAREIFERLVSG